MFVIWEAFTHHQMAQTQNYAILMKVNLLTIKNTEPQSGQDQGLIREDRETNHVELYFS